MFVHAGDHMTYGFFSTLSENATEALKEYYASIGGKEKMFEETKAALNGRKRGRQSNSTTPVEPTKRIKKEKSHPLDSTPPVSAKAAEWKPPSGSWEDHVETVDMCQDENDGTFIVYLTWKNGKKTQHPKEVIYRRCPQKVCTIFAKGALIRSIAQTDQTTDASIL